MCAGHDIGSSTARGSQKEALRLRTWVEFELQHGDLLLKENIIEDYTRDRGLTVRTLPAVSLRYLLPGERACLLHNTPGDQQTVQS